MSAAVELFPYEVCTSSSLQENMELHTESSHWIIASHALCAQSRHLSWGDMTQPTLASLACREG
jgi:hypothetical protein